jgi:transcriptional regulator ATRX
LVIQGKGLLEGKIYRRQVTKEGLAARVVDKHEVKRLYNNYDIADLFDRQGEDNADGDNDGEEAEGDSQPGSGLTSYQ